MRDEDYGSPFVAKAAYPAHELIGFLGGEHGGGFVEDEQPRIAGERLDDLEPLLRAHRERLDTGGRVEHEPGALAEAAHAIGRRGRVVPAAHA